MLQLSVTIITKNEEGNIGKCIDSIKEIADEIIVVDSFSSDATAEIALHKGAIVKQEKFHSHIEQKNLAVRLASNDLIFSLDADEMADAELVNSIREIKKSSYIKAFTMNRCAFFCGKRIRHGLWYPDKKLRLFDRRMATWGGLNPHDKVILTQPCAVQHLRGNILHYSFGSMQQYRQKGDQLIAVYIQSLYNAGRKTNLSKIIINPLWTFVNGYVLRLGFLDGYYGLIISINSARYTFIKHSRLYRLQNSSLSYAD